MAWKGLMILWIVLLSWMSARGAQDQDPTLVGWWPLDEGVGDVAYDATPLQNHGSFQGQPQWVAGVLDGGLALDGRDDAIHVGVDPNLTMLAEVTVSAWLKLDAADRDQKIAGAMDGRMGGYKLGLYRSNKIEMEIRDFANQYAINRNVAGGTELDVESWYHVAGVYSQGRSLRTYVNGVLDREWVTSRMLAPTLGGFVMGHDPAAPAYFLNGTLDDVRVHARALSEQEIAALALPPIKDNDDCFHAEAIGEVTAHPFDTREATFDGDGACMRSPNIWYCYTAACTGDATVSLCGSAYDTMLAVYKGCVCENKLGRVVGCNDDACGLQSELTFPVMAGDQYLIEIGGYADRAGTGVLTITCEGDDPVSFDLGDAPDSTNDLHIAMAAYEPEFQDPILGFFPTTFLGNGGTDAQGPLHHQPLAVAHLGPRVSLELEAYKGPDQDKVNNIDLIHGKSDQDGAEDGVLLPIDMPHGGWTTFEYLVNVLDPDGALWVNVWCDWNRDGDWDDVIMTDSNEDPHYVVPEWAVQNQYLYDLAEGLHQLSTPALLSWHPAKGPKEIWMRITLSEVPWQGGENPKAVGNGGSGPAAGYAIGETEDYFFQPAIPSDGCELCQDLNGDGRIDFDDFYILLDEWFKNCLGR